MTGDNYIASIFDDFKRGRLKSFKLFMDDRIYKLHLAQESSADYKTAVIPKLSSYPSSIYFSADEEANQKSSKWNKCYEEYYKLDQVSTEEDTTFRF